MREEIAMHWNEITTAPRKTALLVADTDGRATVAYLDDGGVWRPEFVGCGGFECMLTYVPTRWADLANVLVAIDEISRESLLGLPN